MKRLFLFALLICAVSSAYHPCIIKDKGKSDIRVIDIDDFSTDDSSSSESDILTLHLPEKGRKEAGSHKDKGKGYCKKDEDCDQNSICVGNIICVKATRRNLDSLEGSANQLKYGRCNKGQQCPHISEHDDSYVDKIFIE